MPVYCLSYSEFVLNQSSNSKKLNKLGFCEKQLFGDFPELLNIWCCENTWLLGTSKVYTVLHNYDPLGILCNCANVFVYNLLYE